MAFNLYDAVKMITDYKTGWHEADKAGKKDEAKKYAELAKPIYEQLVSNGYSDVAKVLENSNDVRSKEYLATFNKNTTPDSSMPEAKDITTADGMINDIYGIQRTNMGDMKNKYDFLEDYNINHNHYESDIGKSIMANYQYQGKTASENAVAEGGASNGGNIDSYAAANANRQQLAFTNAGNQAILNDFNARIGNYRDILNDMGINLQNQEKGMQTTINQKQTEEQRTFENDETSKNNDVNRKVTISEVTGHVPNEWALSNNYYLNDDGTLKDEYKDVDFSAVMAKAKATGNTNAYNEAATARYVKIMSDYANYGKYDDGNYIVPGLRRTESGRRFEKEIEATKELSANELTSKEKLTQAEIEAEERNNQRDNSTKLQITEKEIEAKQAEAEQDEDWTEVLKEYDLTDNAKYVLNTYAHEAWENKQPINIFSVLAENTNILTAYDASEILKMYKITDAVVAEEFKEEYNGKVKTKADWIKLYTWYDPKAKKDEEPEYTPEDIK